jgi:hypothetical protein
MGTATTGDVFAALYAAHQVGDHWVQTGYQAAVKGKDGWEGRRACAAHVATLTAVKAAALAAVHVAGHRLHPRRAAVALAADAVSHYLADRRSHYPQRGLVKLAGLTGRGDFWLLGMPREGRDDNPVLGTGGYALDQAFHTGCLWIAALACAG